MKRTGAKIVYVDINDDLTKLSFNAIIFQNTFGRIKKQTIDKIKAEKIFLIEDCVLSIGSKIDDINLGSFGDISFFSLEVSDGEDSLYKDKMISRLLRKISTRIVEDLFNYWYFLLICSFV